MKIIHKLKRLILGYKSETVDDFRKRGVMIGNNVAIYSSFIDDGHGFLVEIGNDVTISNATILAHDASTKRALGYTKVGKVKIGDNVFIGYGSIILPGVTVGNDVIIGAGTVVRNNIPNNSVVMGNPAEIVCSTSDYLEKWKRKMESAPVYETYWKDKKDEEKRKMIEELDHIIGFDI